MSSGFRVTDFSRLFGESTQELYSDKFYDAMNRDESNLSIYDQICQDKLICKEKSKMMPICKKYLRFLDNSKVWGDKGNEYDVTLLLNYWLYDKISSIYNTTDIHKISIDFSAFQFIWDNSNYSRKHEYYYQKFKPDIDIFKEEDWKKKKELYEYYVNYDTLFRMANGFTSKCEEYYGKIQEMISVYKFFEGKCSSKEYKCPYVFSKCKDKNLESSLEELSCHEAIKSRRASSSEGSSFHHPPGPAERHVKPADGLSAESRTKLESGNSGIGTKVSHTVLGAAPVLLTATALYRYTPLGPWIRRFGGGRTNSVGAIDVVPNYMQGTGDIFSDNDANYISYQPM